MNLSEKLNYFYQLFIAFLQSALNFKLFEKIDPHSSIISEYLTSKDELI